jgi:hypothetical protein
MTRVIAMSPSTQTRQIAIRHVLDMRIQFEEENLDLAPEFQRNSIWPSSAKAYLIDSILRNRPVPVILLQAKLSPRTGRFAYYVVDGQQRLRAILEFLDDRFRLPRQYDEPYRSRRFSDLDLEHQEAILSYSLVVEELEGYTDEEIRDIFVRLNRYVVRLSRQELRHARESGAFAAFVEDVGTWDFWRVHKVFSPNQIGRMRPVEFAAELAILLIEGPQDKKRAVDLYYGEYQDQFPGEKTVLRELRDYLGWIEDALPELRRSRFRKPVDLYALIGALHRLSQREISLSQLNSDRCGQALLNFERHLNSMRVSLEGGRYLAAASAQTDNLAPRMTRIEVLEDVLLNAR